MEFTPFRMLVFSVVAFLLIVLISSIFIAPDTDVVSKISDSFKFAEVEEGKLIETRLSFPEGIGIASDSLETENRNVVMRCTDPYMCTPERISYNDRRVTFLKDSELDVYARCVYEINLYKCRLYIGQEPAQLIVENIEIADNNESIKVKVKNIGDLNAEFITNSLTIYRKALSEGKWKEYFYKNLDPITEGLLVSEESKEFEFEFGRMIKGLFIARFRSQGEEAGFDETESEFTVYWDDDGCRTDKLEETLIIGSNCMSKYSCRDCEYAFECKEKWQKQIPEKENLFETTDPNYTIIEYPLPLSGECEEETDFIPTTPITCINDDPTCNTLTQ